MRILLINPPLYNFDTKRRANFPLGLGYIAKVLLDQGLKVDILDILINEISKKEVEKYIENNRFDLIGITGIVSTLDYIVWLSKVIKKNYPETIIIAGGALATTSHKVLLENSDVDIAVLGEGENIIKNLVQCVKKKESLSAVKGIYYKNNDGKIIKNDPEKRISDLDSILFPAWNLFATEKYINSYTPLLDLKWKHKRRWINIVTSRGCPYKCIFCGKTFGNNTFLRTAENIFSEIEQLKRIYNIEHINFCDDFFAVDKKRVLKLCTYLEKINPMITWTASVRADAIDKIIVTAMKKAGCRGYCIGIESGDQKMLDRMHKSSSVDIAEEAIKISKKHGLYVHCSTIIGLPGENQDTINKTVKFLKRTKVYPIPFNFATPLPGSLLYRNSLEQGLFDNEFKYLRKLKGEFHSRLIINCSKLTNNELIKIKKKSESGLRRYYLIRHPVWGIKRLFGHIAHYGPRETIIRLKKALS